MGARTGKGLCWSWFWGWRHRWMYGPLRTTHDRVPVQVKTCTVCGKKIIEEAYR